MSDPDRLRATVHRLLGGHSVRGRTLRGRLARGLLVVAAILVVVLIAVFFTLVRMVTLLDEASPESVARVQDSTQILIAAIVILVVVVVAVGVFAWRDLERSVTDPLARLARASRLAAGGDHEHAIPVEGTNEVAALAADVEHMRRELVQQVAEVRESHAETERAHELLREQALELERSNRELERSNRDLEQFAYVASHDLQEPLRKIASFTQLLQKRYGGQLDQRADQYIGFAVDGAKRMQQLIQDLLSFSRVGRSGAAPQDVDLEDVLAQVLRDLSVRIAESHAQVTHDPLPAVSGERPLLAMLLANLVGNGLKFRHPDRPPHVHLSARPVGGAWELSCTDNGIGIDPKYAERVFVIFQRLHPKDVYSGTGIGLALVKRVVEHHGGRVWVEPAPDGGTTVRWTLPAVAAARAPVRHRSARLGEAR
jgi:signal transduction histidine kinase